MTNKTTNILKFSWDSSQLAWIAWSKLDLFAIKIYLIVPPSGKEEDEGKFRIFFKNDTIHNLLLKESKYTTYYTNFNLAKTIAQNLYLEIIDMIKDDTQKIEI